MDYLEKSLSLKLKSSKLQRGNEGGDTLITMTLEFTSNNNLAAILFDGMPSGGARLKCYFFDEDNIVFSKQPPGKIEGVVTGKAGDAFRVTQSVPNDVLAKTKKIAFRMEAAKK